MYLILACVLNKVSLRIYLGTVHWIFCATTAKYKGKSRQMTERGVRWVKDCNFCMVKEIFIRMLKLKKSSNLYAKNINYLFIWLTLRWRKILIIEILDILVFFWNALDLILLQEFRSLCMKTVSLSNVVQVFTSTARSYPCTSEWLHPSYLFIQI